MTYTLSNVIPEPPDKRNFMLAVPAGVIQNLPASVDLRAYTGGIENQGHLNECVANGTASELEYVLDKAGRFKHQSRKFIYWNATNYWSNLRGKDGGAYPSDGIKSCYQFGSCAETTWPYDETLGNIQPSAAAIAEGALHKVTKYERVGYWGQGDAQGNSDNWQSIDLVKATLAMGYTVGFGMTVCNEIFSMIGPLGSATNNYTKIVSIATEYIGGHYMVFVGYNADGFIAENSWGTAWGDNGYGLFSFASINQACMDALVVTAFDGIEYAPNWSMLPAPPLTATINSTPDVQYEANLADNNIFCKVLTVVPAGGTPGYEYAWSTTDSHVACELPHPWPQYGAVPTDKAQPVVSFDNAWPKGEQRSVTVTCTISDYSLPRETTTVQTLLRLCNDIDRESTKGKAYRLYQAAFNRVPDAAGLVYWISALDNGASLYDVAAGFVNSAEFQSLYGGIHNAEFLALIYQNVLHRESDAGGLAWWIQQLYNGASRVDVLVGFSESAENKARVIW